ncbi:MAG: winged helix-turn-helix transcriptional regulator [Trueperaceae bacterium]|nr:winged helix-turn-helix transcriptional regulator [Trueperaceae bacterium]
MLNHYRADTAFDALGDATRRAIVERLSQGSASVSELAEPLGISLAAVLQHLQVLERCRLVSSEKVGRVRQCHLDEVGLNVLQRWIDDRRALWERRYDRLAAVLGEGEEPN